MLRGTSGRDVIRGTPGDELVDALGGNDAVYGAGGGLGRDRAWVDRRDSTASIETRYPRR